MHVQLLAISSAAIHDHRHNDELVLCDKVADASLILGRLVAAVCCHVELERRYERQGKEEQQAAVQLQQAYHGDKGVQRSPTKRQRTKSPSPS